MVGIMEARGHRRRPWRAAAIGNGEPGSSLGHSTNVGGVVRVGIGGGG
jgi:hypothetical protein